mmetsp:Transcript_42311/g.122336  ORF Transcript_42311/g.122336 Transcript_42311/m.122336 type:complete len:306 (-) Transcript_42311:235-1152(-)
MWRGNNVSDVGKVQALTCCRRSAKVVPAAAPARRLASREIGCQENTPRAEDLVKPREAAALTITTAGVIAPTSCSTCGLVHGHKGITIAVNLRGADEARGAASAPQVWIAPTSTVTHILAQRGKGVWCRRDQAETSNSLCGPATLLSRPTIVLIVRTPATHLTAHLVQCQEKAPRAMHFVKTQQVQAITTAPPVRSAPAQGTAISPIHSQECVPRAVHLRHARKIQTTAITALSLVAPAMGGASILAQCNKCCHCAVNSSSPCQVQDWVIALGLLLTPAYDASSAVVPGNKGMPVALHMGDVSEV